MEWVWALTKSVAGHSNGIFWTIFYWLMQIRIRTSQAITLARRRFDRQASWINLFLIHYHNFALLLFLEVNPQRKKENREPPFCRKKQQQKRTQDIHTWRSSKAFIWKYMLYTLGITCRALFIWHRVTLRQCARKMWRLRFLVIDPLVMCVRPRVSKWHWVWHFPLPRLLQTAPVHPHWSHFSKVIFFQCFETFSFKQERKRATMTTFYPIFLFLSSTNWNLDMMSSLRVKR